VSNESKNESKIGYSSGRVDCSDGFARAGNSSEAAECPDNDNPAPKAAAGFADRDSPENLFGQDNAYC